MQINVKKVNKYAKIPIFATEESAGADLFNAERKEITIEPNSTTVISTGLQLEIPKGYVGLIYARSGLATKRCLGLANSVGVIDSDYRGEVKVALYNHSDIEQTICPDERIAQIVIMPYPHVNFLESEQIGMTKRGEQGFGSTGKY